MDGGAPLLMPFLPRVAVVLKRNERRLASQAAGCLSYAYILHEHEAGRSADGRLSSVRKVEPPAGAPPAVAGTVSF